MRKSLHHLLVTLAAVAGLTGVVSPATAHGAMAISTEERFQDVFITAGYSTAFGAALGTAMLAFVDEPGQQLQYVAIGASLGFIAGSVLGAYLVFAPVLAGEMGGPVVADAAAPAPRFWLQPTIDKDSGAYGAGLGWNVAKF